MTRSQCLRHLASIAVLLVVLGGTAPLAAQQSSGVDGQAAFEMLKKLEGRWAGTFGYDGVDETYPVVHEFHVFGKGTAVMESMFSGTDDEMISMYHLEGDDLVMTHYCAAGNQPRMKFDPEEASATALPFGFAGGSNLDPAKDGHLHSGKIALNDDGTIESSWTRWVEGKQVGVVRLQLSREAATAEE